MTPLWLKWWIGSVDDTKLRMVACECLRPVGDVVAVWASILERCARADAPGTCDSINYDEIGFQLGYNESHVESIVDAMRHRGLLNGNSVTAWARRQETKEDKTNAERQRRHRERKVTDSNGSNALRNVTRDSNALRNTDGMGKDGMGKEEEPEVLDKPNEPTRISSRRPIIAPEYPTDFLEFWNAYPRHVGKVDAYKTWLARLQADYTAEQMIKAAKNYAENCRKCDTVEKFRKMPATFLGPGDHIKEWLEHVDPLERTMVRL